jgi:hypothetical protein
MDGAEIAQAEQVMTTFRGAHNRCITCGVDNALPIAG